jgi:adenylyltransferase/sulfurtransferase
MRLGSTSSPTSVKFVGKAIPGAEGRQKLIPGFDQEVYSKASVVCVGAGGIISHIAPTLCRKGIGRITLLDRDVVEVSNLNRQRFYEQDIGKNKAVRLAENLQRESIAATEIRGYALRLEDAIERKVDLSCDVAICGVDNNPARVAASRFFRNKSIPVIFTAVSRDGDHGYVFVQERHGPCIGCLFPDMADDDRYPCPGTPAVADILQAVGALAVYAVDTLLMKRARNWNYRRVSLSDGAGDGASVVESRTECAMFRPTAHENAVRPGSHTPKAGQSNSRREKNGNRGDECPRKSGPLKANRVDKPLRPS